MILAGVASARDAILLVQLARHAAKDVLLWRVIIVNSARFEVHLIDIGSVFELAPGLELWVDAINWWCNLESKSRINHGSVLHVDDDHEGIHFSHANWVRMVVVDGVLIETTSGSVHGSEIHLKVVTVSLLVEWSNGDFEILGLLDLG